MGGVITIIILGFIVIVIYVVLSINLSIQNNKHEKDSLIVLNSLIDFNPTEKYISSTGGCSIAYDKDLRKLCIIDCFKKTHIFKYEQILQSEIVIDGETHQKHSTTNTVGRSVLGGLVGGGIGAAIGGVTSNTRNVEKIKLIDLKIIVNEPSNPVFRINFLSIETSKDSVLFRLTHTLVERWHGIVVTLMSFADNKEDNVLNKSVADEIFKFKKLLDEGIITREEFEKMKVELLKN